VVPPVAVTGVNDADDWPTVSIVAGMACVAITALFTVSDKFEDAVVLLASVIVTW
jgi:hypothetical protein